MKIFASKAHKLLKVVAAWGHDRGVLEVEALPGRLVLRATDGKVAISDTFDVPEQQDTGRGVMPYQDLKRIARARVNKTVPFDVVLSAPFGYDFSTVMHETNSAVLNVDDLRSVLAVAAKPPAKAKDGCVAMFTTNCQGSLTITCHSFEATMVCDTSSPGSTMIDPALLMKAIRTAPVGSTIRLGLRHNVANATFDECDLRVALANKRAPFHHPMTGDLVDDGAKERVAA